MTRRKLTQDEIDLWHRVADKAERMHPRQRAKCAPGPVAKTKAVENTNSTR